MINTDSKFIPWLWLPIVIYGIIAQTSSAFPTSSSITTISLSSSSSSSFRQMNKYYHHHRRFRKQHKSLQMQLQQCQQQQGRRRTISNCLPNNFQLYSSSSATMMDDGLINKGEENSSSNSSNDNGGENMSRLGSTLTKIGLLTYIASMCAFLPVFLLPILALHRLGIIKSRVTKEHLSLRLGQFCSRWLMRLIPFAKVRCTSTVTLSAKSTSSSSSSKKDETEQSSVETKPEPCIWVCNHTSMLDIFVLLAYDLQMRGTKRRPIKIVYWKDLEKNIITKLLFTSCGFIPVEMSDNGQGNANVYKKSSFKNLLKSIKEAFVDGFE